MRPRAPLVFGLLVVAALSPMALAADLPPNWDPDRFLDVGDIRPGMRGVGHSVFEGHRIEEFSVEILGVLPTATPSGDMILARLSGRDLETTGIIAGMSGSPIYVEGKLIGALAFGWSFATQPITGITPIREMLALDARPSGSALPVGVFETGEPRSGLDPARWNRLWTAEPEEVLSLLSPAAPPAAMDWSPVRTPVAVAGLGGQAGGLTATWLEDRGFLPVQGGSGGAGADVGSERLEPGSSVMVQLIRGDASIGAVGTVTWTEGDRVYAFGHPFLGLGGIEYPLCRASVVTVLPSALSSFKMGVSGREVGAVTQDYRPGVAGYMGRTVTMVPMTLTLALGQRREELSFEILDHPNLSAPLSGLLAANAMDALDKASGPVTLRVQTTVELTDGRTVSRRTRVAGFSPPSALAGEVARVVGLLHGNPIEEVHLARVAVTVEAEPAIRASFLNRVELSPGPYRPGDGLRVRAVFSDYRGEEWSTDLPVTLPGSLPPGPYTLSVCDGSSASRKEQERAPGRFQPRDLDLLIDRLNQELPQDALVIRLEGGSANPVVGGRELPDLPAAWRVVLGSPLTVGRATAAARSVYHLREERVGKVLFGCRDVALVVESHP